MDNSANFISTIQAGKKMWCFSPTTAYDAAESLQRLAIKDNEYTFPVGATVSLTGRYRAVNTDLWLEVTYEYKAIEKNLPVIKVTPTAWVKATYLDEYNELFPGYVLDLPSYTSDTTTIHQTLDPNDAQQYLSVDGLDRFNLCGEFCATYIVHQECKQRNSESPEVDIVAVLNKWRNTSKSSYDKVFTRGKNEGTSPEHEKLAQSQIIALLKMYGISDADMHSSQQGYSLAYVDLKNKLASNYLIANVSIGKSNGLLKSKDDPLGIAHWVVVTQLSRNGRGVLLYNPFPNKWEEYSYDEFIASSIASLCLWVTRTSPVEPQIKAKAETLKRVVHIDGDSEPGAKQFIKLDGQRKTELCGEFSVAYILSNSIEATLANLGEDGSNKDNIAAILKAYGYLRQNKTFSIQCVLDYWKEAQLDRYTKRVGQNSGTITEDLKTILNAYGYASSGDLIDLTTWLTITTTFQASAGNMKKMLEDYYLIAGVLINKLSGKLCNRVHVTDHTNYTLHWVVVENIEPVGKHYVVDPSKAYRSAGGGSGGWVTLYNPFNNSWEGYSYMELIYSMMFEKTVSGMIAGTGWGGLWVPRRISPRFIPQTTQGSAGGRSMDFDTQVNKLIADDNLSTEPAASLSPGEIMTRKVASTLRSRVQSQQA